MTALEFMKDFYSTRQTRWPEKQTTVADLMEAYAEHKNSEMASNLIERTTELEHCRLALDVLAQRLSEMVLFPKEPRLQTKGVSRDPGSITELVGPSVDPKICQDPGCPDRMYHPANEHTLSNQWSSRYRSRSGSLYVFTDGRWTIES